jgi:hypothetical protein
MNDFSTNHEDMRSPLPIRSFTMRPLLKKICLAALLLSALAVTAPASARTQGQRQTLHLLMVGVTRSKLAPGRDLPNADSNARDVAAFFRQHRPDGFERVTGEQALLSEQATRQNILARFDQMIREAAPGDRAVIFLAGHGGPLFQGGDWEFAAHDQDISRRTLQQKIEQLHNKGVLVILILDSCHSGYLAEKETKALVIAACDSNRESWDSTNYDNMVFTHLLLQGLRGWANVNRDGRITVAELRTWVTDQVEQTCGRRFFCRWFSPVFYLPPGMDENLPLARLRG